MNDKGERDAVDMLWDMLWPGPGENPYPLNKDEDEEEVK